MGEDTHLAEISTAVVGVPTHHTPTVAERLLA